MIKSFYELNEIEKLKFYRFTKGKNIGNKQSYDEFLRYHGGEAFDLGKNYFVWIDNNKVKGCIAAVTKEISVRGEAFILGLYASGEDHEEAKALIRTAVNRCVEFNALEIKLGIPYVSAHLNSAIVEQGFQLSYRASIYKLDIKKCNNYNLLSQFELVPVDSKNKKDYIEIHNNAFKYAPNGSSISVEELGEKLQSYRYRSDYIGLARYNSEYVGIYEVNTDGNTGWIHTVGIHKDYWGRGFGKEIVMRSIALLKINGMQEVNLIAMSNNERAIKLYKSVGFNEERTISYWYSRLS